MLTALSAALPALLTTALQQLATAPDHATPAPSPAPSDTAPRRLSTAPEPADVDEPTDSPEPAPVSDGAPEADCTTPTVAPEPDPTAPEPEPSAAPSAPLPGSKAARGALRATVARLLADNPGDTFTVTQAAKLVGNKSGGAVGNALEWLTAHGHAARVNDKPRTYSATPATAHAAATAHVSAPTVTAPAAPKPARTRAPKKAEHAAAPAPVAPATTAAPDPAASPVPAWDGRSPLPRPNGSTYHPRTLADTSDVAALRTLRAEGVPALLYGPPGTGKTSLVEAAFPDAITVCGDGDTQVSDLIGSYTQRPDGGYEFVYGPLVIAMQEGRVLFLDDATLIPPTVLAALYPGMDGRRQITVKEHKGETITAAEGFYVVAGHNPNVHGAILSDALSSRFSVQIEVSSDYDLARTLKIDASAVRVARNLATRKSKGEIGWAPQLRELLAFHKIQTILGKDAAWSNLLGIAPAEDRDTVATVLKAALGKDITHLALGKQL
ncbi:AAA family ATPase [Actinocrinis puniceicyclus]|uniref:AAA family ATPase n=2 Tax=Actinocrinis puniceicyclus TaxID=977794 RepID=A0A8J7WVV2_9ACTN|nr:AAA family ATPase [Actinocrinis puniceicyclus]